MHAYELSITAKTATTKAHNIGKAARTHHPPRGPPQLPNARLCTQTHAATASQAHYAALCRVASVRPRALACTPRSGPRGFKKTANGTSAIPSVVGTTVPYCKKSDFAGYQLLQRITVTKVFIPLGYCTSCTRKIRGEAATTKSRPRPLAIQGSPMLAAIKCRLVGGNYVPSPEAKEKKEERKRKT